MKFGRKPTKWDNRTLQFTKYSQNVPVPPSGHANITRVEAALKDTDVAQLWPMDGNDNYGDCTIAGVAHLDTVNNGLVGRKAIMPAQDVTNLYFQLTGGQDSGLMCLDVLNYWTKNAVNGNKILAYVSVKPTDHTAVKQAIWLFGGLYIGFAVTENLLDQFNNGQPWTPGTLTNDGHCVVVPNYSNEYVRVLTWGATQLGTWDWWDQCVQESYAVLAPESQLPGYDPGFDFVQLEADLKAV